MGQTEPFMMPKCSTHNMSLIRRLFSMVAMEAIEAVMLLFHQMEELNAPKIHIIFFCQLAQWFDRQACDDSF